MFIHQIVGRMNFPTCNNIEYFSVSDQEANQSGNFVIILSEKLVIETDEKVAFVLHSIQLLLFYCKRLCCVGLRMDEFTMKYNYQHLASNKS